MQPDWSISNITYSEIPWERQRTEEEKTEAISAYFSFCLCWLNSIKCVRATFGKKNTLLLCVCFSVSEEGGGVVRGGGGVMGGRWEAGEGRGWVCLWRQIQSLHKLWMCSGGKRSISKCHMVLSQGIQLCVCVCVGVCVCVCVCVRMHVCARVSVSCFFWMHLWLKGKEGILIF